MNRHSALAELARLYRVQLNHHDGLGHHRHVSDDALVSILRALGASVAGIDDAEEALRSERARRAARVLRPFVVAWQGRRSGVSVQIPKLARGAFALRGKGDAGATFAIEGLLESLSTEDELEIEGARLRRATIDLPPDLALDYYALTLEALGAEHRSRLVVAPERGRVQPDVTRAFGVFAPLYALRTKEKPDGGDLGVLEDTIRWVASQGGSLVGTLPLLAAMPGTERELAPSPYAPASRLFWNELYLDLAKLPELGSSDEAKRAMGSETYRRGLAEAREDSMMDYVSRFARLRTVLEPLAKQAFASDVRRAAIEQFVKDHPRARDYAEFRAATERHGAWPTWMTGPRGGVLTPRDYGEDAARYHLYAQFSLHEQLSGLSERAKQFGDGLYLDLPLGVDTGGYDVWRERPLFARGASAGAPPDGFFTQGQNWGFPPLLPTALAEDGYRYLAECYRNHMRYAGALRIDHVMGLHRLYWVPDGLGATEGAYVETNAEELYAILALESSRAQTTLVGEDLGTVPQDVRPAMAKHGVAGMYVLQFDLRDSDDEPLREPAAHSVASLNTHDMPPFASFLDGGDIADRIALGLFTESEAAREREHRTKQRKALVRFLQREHLIQDDERILDGALRFLGRSQAQSVLVSLEDLWLEQKPQNVPGTFRERPNWRRKHALDLEEITTDPRVLGGLEALRGAREQASQRAKREERESREGGMGSELTAHDAYLFNEGTHERLYEKLGAHLVSHGGERGVRFAVWAPNAEHVSVIGDFNGWNGESHALAPQGSSGIWMGFVPGLTRGTLYKYRIHSRFNGYRVDKADPYGFRHEEPPRTASIVWDLDNEWHDDEWMKARSAKNAMNAPLSVYEVHLGSWMRREDGTFLSYREIAPKLAAHVTKLGFTHVELMPVMEHPFYGSWGYEVTGYFAPSSRFGSPQDFMFLVDTLHQAGVGVILDWVPAHFPTDEHSLSYFDGTHLYEHADPRRGFHPDWKSAIFNYDRHEVRAFLLSNVMFWLDRYHIDGIRIDAVASMLYLDYSRNAGEWIPNDYGGRENLGALSLFRLINERVYKSFPDVQTIAEESTAWPMVSRPTFVGGLGFGFKWDMGWMHDTLQYMSRDPVHRGYHHHELTFRMLYAFTENFMLPLSHDEVVHGKGSLLSKMPGDEWQRFANMRLLLSYMYAQPGKKLLFMGTELAPWTEWSHERSLEWFLRDFPTHAGIERLVAALNHVYRQERALHELDLNQEGFQWIAADDSANSCYAFLRKSRNDEERILVMVNATPVPRPAHRVGVPHGGHWNEIFNSDATEYGGTGVGNFGGLHAETIGAHGFSQSITPTLPPLGILLFRNSGA